MTLLRLWMPVSSTVLCVLLAFRHGPAEEPPQTQLGFTSVAKQPPRDVSPAKQGRIRGRVVSAETGLPLHRAKVTLSSISSRDSRATGTDPQGRYEFRSLPPAQYTLTASKAGFLTLPLGARRPREPGRVLQLGGGQDLDGVDLALPRGGVIAGRIFDELGEPVIDASVQVLRYQYGAGQRRVVPAGRADRSNDLGEFRIFGLPPGSYYVSASLRSNDGFDADSDLETGFAPTYYPGTPELGAGQRVSIAIGQELTNINFSLLPTRTARIAGVVLDSRGRPLAGALARLVQRHGTVEFSSTSEVRARPDGSFVFARLAPGNYLLLARGKTDVGLEFASTAAAVSGQDLDNLALGTSPGAVARGEVVFEVGAKPDFTPSSIRVTAHAADVPTGLLTGSSTARLDQDWTFRLSDLFGGQVIVVSGLPPPWSLKAVLLNERDVTDTGVEFRGIPEAIDLRIVLTNRATEVTGTVLNAQRAPARGCTVIVFATDSSKWTPHTRFVRTSRCTDEGRFTMADLPPESYRALAVEYVTVGESTDPEFLEAVRVQAEQFSLAEGERKTLALRLWTPP